jgi:hypothetical protein
MRRVVIFFIIFLFWFLLFGILHKMGIKISNVIIFPVAILGGFFIGRIFRDR